MKKLIALCLLLLLPSAWATPMQSHAVIRDKVSAFVQEQTRAMPGKVSYQVGDIDERIALPICPALEVFLPQGTALNGKTSVGVRCKDGWSIFVAVQIRITLPMLIASHPLQMGQVLNAEDIATQNAEVNQPGTLTDPAQAIGKTLKFSLAAGQTIKQDMLRAPWVVTQGQTVKLLVRMNGLTISSEGQALGNAAEGQTVQIRTSSGRAISGVASSNSTVEIRP